MFDLDLNPDLKIIHVDGSETIIHVDGSETIIHVDGSETLSQNQLLWLKLLLLDELMKSK